jgi:DnaJ-class molecular chaperone
MSEEAIKKGICPKCKGKRVVEVKRKKIKCPRCKGMGIRVDEIF